MQESLMVCNNRVNKTVVAGLFYRMYLDNSVDNKYGCSSFTNRQECLTICKKKNNF
jgi:hypothetical protein